MSINLNENEYQKVLADIEADLEAVLKSESESLAKGFPPSDDEGSSPDAGGEASESAAPAESSDAPPAEGSESGPADAAPAPDASASPDAVPPGADPAAGGGEEDLESKLMALPEEQLRHLYMAAKQALFARMSQAGAPGAGGPPAGMPPDAGGSPADAPAPAMAPPAGPPAPAADPSQMPPPAMKSDAGLGLMKPKAKGEMSSAKANGGPGEGAVKLGKSEEKYAEMELKVELMAKALNLVLGQPVRKAITGISQLAHVPKNDGGTDKPEVKLSKTEITAKLKSLDFAKLTKNDRTAINNYYNKFEVSGIAHLLK